MEPSILGPSLLKASLLEWVNKLFGLEPHWRTEPDLDTLQRIIHQQTTLPLAGEAVTIEPFAQGAFNKLYTIRPARGHDDDSHVRSDLQSPATALLLRASLPVCPRYKTESEAATIRFVQERTSLPVPRIYAFDSNLRPDVGFEWIIMERMPGKPLRHQWRSMSIDAKAALVRAVAQFQAELLCPANRFTSVGNILEADRASGTFRIGPMVSPIFFWGPHKRPDTPCDPFESSHDWLLARLNVVLSEQGRIIKETQQDEDRQVAVRSLACAQKLCRLLPKFFPPSTREETVLWHHDLSGNNILVDDSGALAAIVDWECVSAVPMWRARDIPKFLRGRKRLRAVQADDYGSESESDVESGEDEPRLDNQGKTELYWIHLLEFEQTLLRDIYLETMELLAPLPEDQRAKDVELLDFESAVALCDYELATGVVSEWADDNARGEVWNLREALGR
ncbi:kinase-like domain-containing protein [Ilyonectria destructans]|nr:kinase-like domain-containing protein [Ilyonectria destructans]